jgi:hypothetical protein
MEKGLYIFELVCVECGEDLPLFMYVLTNILIIIFSKDYRIAFEKQLSSFPLIGTIMKRKMQTKINNIRVIQIISQKTTNIA